MAKAIPVGIILAAIAVCLMHHSELLGFQKDSGQQMFDKFGSQTRKSSIPDSEAANVTDEFLSVALSLKDLGNASQSLFAWDLEYFGQWRLMNESQPIDNFVNNVGGCLFINESESKTLRVEIKDGKYEDNRYIFLVLSYENNTVTNNTSYTNPNTNMTMYYFNHYQQENQIKCSNVGFNLSYFYTNSMQPANGAINDKINASFSITGGNCSFAVNMMYSDNDNSIQAAAMNYSIVITLLCCGHLYACIQMIKYYAENEAEANKLSLLTVGFLTCWDLLLCLFHLYQALTNNEYFHFFITPAFWYFILASIFETRLLLLLWKARYGNTYLTMQDIRRGILVFYFKFYGFLITIIILANYFIYTRWFLALSAGMFIPQIIHNAIRGHRLKIDFYYVFALGFLRIVLPIYAKGCPENVFDLTPDYLFCITYGSAILFQLMLMFLQSRLGSRFFIPGCFLPPKFNYYIEIVYGSAQDETCAICMEDISKPPTDPNVPLLANGPTRKKLKIMETPCHHKFHESCLKNWMNIKLECPLCKTSIPPLD